LCSIKMRMFYNDYSCPLCKMRLVDVIFTQDQECAFESLDLKKGVHYAPSLVYFESQEHLNLFLEENEYKCVICKNNQKFNNINQLKKHLEDKHGRYYCEICLASRKEFFF